MKLRRLRSARGASLLTPLFLIFILIILFFVVFEWYSVYTISTSIHKCFERSIKTITTLNEVNVYGSLRENMLELDEEGAAKLITIDELVSEVSQELGLEAAGRKFCKKNSIGNTFYAISDIDIDSYYVNETNTICFEATGVIEIPLSILRDSSFTTIRLELDVRSMYASTLRADR